MQDEQLVPVTNRYIAFLRAINVGKRTVQMARLREIATELGLTDVATFIASGNLIFRDPQSRTAAVVEQWLTTELALALGFHSDVFVRTPAENARIANMRFGDSKEFPPANHALYIGMLHQTPSADVVAALMSAQTPVDQFFVAGREFYWLCAKTIGTSDVTGAKLEKLLGAPMTMRNVTSMRKLAALYPE